MNTEPHTRLRVLFIEDSEDDMLLLLRELKRSYSVSFERVDTEGALNAALERQKWDLIISDYIMPHLTGLRALEVFKNHRLEVPFIVVSGKVGEDIAVEALKAGAHDFIVKGHLDRFLPAISRELRDARTRREQRKVEEALRESEDRFSVIAATATDAIVMMDNKGKISYWNPAAERTFGYPAEEAIGKSLHLLIAPPKYHKSFIAGFNTFVKTGQGRSVGNIVEFEATRKDGGIFPVEVSLSAMQIRGHWHAVGIIRDITERKIAEEELKKHHDNLEDLVEKRTAALKKVNEQLQREITDRKIAEEALWKAITRVEEEKAKSEAVIAAMGDGLVIVDRDLKITYQNVIHKNLIGNKIGEFCFKAYCRPDTSSDLCPIKMSFADGRIHKAEKKVVTGRGMADIEIIASPLKDAKGAIIAGIEVVRDVTKRKQMEDELREHRDHLDMLVKERTAELSKANKDLRAEIMRRIQMEKDLIESQRFVHQIADATPNLLYLYDVPESRIVYINTLVKDILGYSPDDLKKKGSNLLSSIIYPEDLRTLEPRIRQFADARDDEIVESEFRMRNVRGEWRWFHSRNVSFKKTGDGKLKLLLGIAQDITERRNAEESLKNSREQLRDLLANIHKVREEERTRISREIHDELGQSMTALKMDISWLIKRMTSEQEPLLEKARMMSKLIDINIQSVKRISAELRPGLLDDLGIAAALEWQTEEFKERTGLKCRLKVSPEDIVLGREVSTAIFRIFQEALTNVVRHADAGKVNVSLRQRVGQLTLQVKDDGKGITKKQISDPKSIGLIGMRERVHFLGGTVVIDGSPGKGTTLTVRIPLKQKINQSLLDK
jgi:PAS domain S-box-containing protein